MRVGRSSRSLPSFARCVQMRLCRPRNSVRPWTIGWRARSMTRASTCPSMRRRSTRGPATTGRASTTSATGTGASFVSPGRDVLTLSPCPVCRRGTRRERMRGYRWRLATQRPAAQRPAAHRAAAQAPATVTTSVIVTSCVPLKPWAWCSDPSSPSANAGSPRTLVVALVTTSSTRKRSRPPAPPGCAGRSRSTVTVTWPSGRTSVRSRRLILRYLP